MSLLVTCLIGDESEVWKIPRQWQIQERVTGTRAVPLGPNSFIFMQVSAKILQNNRLAHQLREILDPPLLCSICYHLTIRSNVLGRVWNIFTNFLNFWTYFSKNTFRTYFFLIAKQQPSWSVADPGFPRGTPNSGVGGWVCQPKILQKISPKTAWKWKTLGQGPKHSPLLHRTVTLPWHPPLLDPPLITEFRIDLFVYRTERHQTVRVGIADWSLRKLHVYRLASPGRHVELL